MSFLALLSELDTTQRHTVLASFLGWTLDAFDYFLLTFVILAVAKEFHTDNDAVTQDLFHSVTAHPVSALLSGWLTDR
jgi:MFS transporter, SHS family, lactate transporter